MFIIHMCVRCEKGLPWRVVERFFNNYWIIVSSHHPNNEYVETRSRNKMRSGTRRRYKAEKKRNKNVQNANRRKTNVSAEHRGGERKIEREATDCGEKGGGIIFS